MNSAMNTAMNKPLSMRFWQPARALALASVALALLSGCTQHKLHQTQAELGAAQACIAKQEVQGQQLNAQQTEILRQLEQVQQQLTAQQQALVARPQVIEREVSKADCPAAQVANNNKPTK